MLLLLLLPLAFAFKECSRDRCAYAGFMTKLYMDRNGSTFVHFPYSDGAVTVHDGRRVCLHRAVASTRGVEGMVIDLSDSACFVAESSERAKEEIMSRCEYEHVEATDECVDACEREDAAKIAHVVEWVRKNGVSRVALMARGFTVVARTYAVPLDPHLRPPTAVMPTWIRVPPPGTVFLQFGYTHPWYDKETVSRGLFESYCTGLVFPVESAEAKVRRWLAFCASTGWQI